ncbi:hypothetical protein S40285_08419 [Stachybotrys chlorohalonatus IBT 40285]|uniref:WSC domain-containing protein n=1 Tax=Stachybotrys chlorohalonatus (strain IBT 40285) TaxID=1283841 RepID=A0A084R0X7_STAC4|nr:hypothetical protein S40285_08419 [Stachybotrys chlorohalonata IBT 40285]
MLLKLLPLLLLTGASQVPATPAPTAAPTLVPGPPEVAARSITSFHTIVSTRYPQNRYSIGYGQFDGEDNFYTAACIDGPFAVSGVWAGCGDVIFTRCIGPTAFARDLAVSCIGTCLTHEVYDYNDDSHSMTPFIACNFPGTYDGSMTLLRTPVAGTTVPTADETLPMATTVTSTTTVTTITTADSGTGSQARDPFGVAMGVLFILSLWVLL